MPPRAKGIREDNLRQIFINDFSGGWNTVKGGLSYNLNETPDILNLIPFSTRLQYRGGYLPFCALPATADGAYFFYDSDGAKHFAVWAGGNLYDCVSGTTVLVEAAVYTAGAKVGYTDFAGNLLWTSPGVPIRKWNPKTGAKGAVVSSGASATPSGTFLFIYLNIVFILQPNFGSGVQKNVMSWAAVDD
ncbi:MAG: hypothetical protein ACRD3W_18580, partial [Terriglobales bacterium]